MRARPILALLLALAPVTALANSQIFIVNINAAGVGFNDPTPATPIGGNPGTTIGEQRLYAFQAAADIWGSILDSKVPIFINAQFTPLACTATQAVLGSAGAATVSRDFAGAGVAQTWYHAALANRIAGQDLSPSTTSTPTSTSTWETRAASPGPAGTSASITTTVARSISSRCCCTSSATASGSRAS